MCSKGSQGASGSTKISQEQFKGVPRDFRDFQGTPGSFGAVSDTFKRVSGRLWGFRKLQVRFRGISGGLTAVPRKINDQECFKASLETSGAFQGITEEFRGAPGCLRGISGGLKGVPGGLSGVLCSLRGVPGGLRSCSGGLNGVLRVVSRDSGSLWGVSYYIIQDRIPVAPLKYP